MIKFTSCATITSDKVSYRIPTANCHNEICRYLVRKVNLSCWYSGLSSRRERDVVKGVDHFIKVQENLVQHPSNIDSKRPL